ncbi:MAG: peptide deformylase [Coxiellaceae bacterium]|nr:peptide deformylase [Coxiellaceae bacterium]
MTVKTVVKLGSAQLATPSMMVEDFSSNDLKVLIQDMKDTMKEKGGVGIAAPQIGVNLCVTIFGFDKSERYPNENSVPFTILINPTIEILSDEMIDGWEGCLSVPGLRGLVSRYQKIKYSGFDENGMSFSRMAEGFHARIVQHECDHLSGILYPERLKNIKYFGFEDELSKNAW